MIRHCVMFRWKEGLSAETISALAGALAQLPSAIPTIRSYSFGRDIGVNNGNADFVVVADFATVDDYLVYRDHPAHKQFVADHITPNISERTAIQFSMGDQ
jgi:hypothetical protein